MCSPVKLVIKLKKSVHSNRGHFSWTLTSGESMATKLVELIANRVVERRNMINDYLRGRACIERFRGS
jgi:hypothetical protein